MPRKKRQPDGSTGQRGLRSQVETLLSQALDSPNVQEKRRLAHGALALWPDAVEAYLVLGEAADSRAEAITYYRQAVAAGQRALGGPEPPADQAQRVARGPQRRAYRQARLQLALALRAQGQSDEAVGHCEELLRQDPKDHQGVRYILASFYSDLNRDADLARLLDQFPEDDCADWAFSRALLAFRRDGATPAARQQLLAAHSRNPYVAEYLLGNLELPDTLPLYGPPGDEAEAICYAGEFLRGWRATPGSITWLRETLAIAPRFADEAERPSLEEQLAAVTELPQHAGETWQVDLRRSKIGADGDEVESWSLLAFQPDPVHVILFTDYVEGPPRPPEVLGTLLESMCRPPDREPRRPECIQVRRKTYYDGWQAQLEGVGIRCELRRAMAEWEAVFERLQELGSGLGTVPEELRQRSSELIDVPQESEEVWQVDVRRMAAWVTEEGPPQRPWLAIVISRTSNMILAQQLRVEEPDESWLWDTLLAAMLAPVMGPPHRPGAIEVVSPDFREHLRARLEALNISYVIRDDLPELDALVGELQAGLSAEDDMTAMCDMPGVTLDQIGSFFEAAADFYRRAPWRVAPADAPIRMHCAKHQTSTWYAIVMGQEGRVLGLALYEDLELLRSIIHSDGVTNTERQNAGLSVMYSEPFEIASRDLEAAERHGWPVAGPEAYPLVLRLNPGMATRPPLAWELELLESALRAVPAFLKRRDRSPDRMTVPVSGGDLTVELAWVD